MKAHYGFIQNNATSRKDLQDLQQRITSNCRSFNKIKTIFVGCHREI